MEATIIGLIFFILGGFGTFGTWTFNKFQKDIQDLKLEIKDLKLENKDSNKKIDLLEKENFCLVQFLNNFLFEFSNTANKNNVKVDQQITDLITKSHKDLSNTISYFKKEKEKSENVTEK